MLALSKIDAVVKKAAAAALKGMAGVRRVESHETVDSYGQDALRIKIVLKRGTAEKVTGDAAIDTLVSINDALQSAGDDRFPILEFTAEEEL